MGSYLAKQPDTGRAVDQRELTPTDVNRWMNLLDGSRPGQVNVQASDLSIIDMDYYGAAEGGYLSTWGQTGCTVIMAMQHVGATGCWAYFSHVNSSVIDGALAHACHCAYQLANSDDIMFVMMGGPGGSLTYKKLLQCIKPLGDRWRYLVLTKPENGLEESVFHVQSGCLALTSQLVGQAHSEKKQFPGFHPQKVPSPAPRLAKRITGHKDFDEAIKGAISREDMWISLGVECGHLPPGLPAESDLTAGAKWIANKQNLLTLLTHLSKQSMYKGLVLDKAAEGLLQHVLSLPES
ncbi:hypothetical protein [Variovorax sp. OV329]|uniref:hypothetical protein n=1 Tax=Variovorax sp. OV329 TaxID=1882825 RepID=UPI0008F059C5|nr:hypothetical protein [Variovorax sp. OV329]SFN47665.1 hypothetical protein SAMN05444747_1292 [Variovorax sp. OV329]